MCVGGGGGKQTNKTTRESSIMSNRPLEITGIISVLARMSDSSETLYIKFPHETERERDSYRSTRNHYERRVWLEPS